MFKSIFNFVRKFSIPTFIETPNKNKLYLTSFQKNLSSYLLHVSNLLCNNYYLNTRGVASGIIMGSHGIGKTSVLKNFSNIIDKKHSNIIPVYINIIDESTKKLVQIDGGFDDILISRAKKYNVVLKKKDFSMNYLAEQLEKENKFMMIIVDEMEELYRSDSSLRGCVDTLSTINHLGNQPTGRFHTLLCGSSESLPLLTICRFNSIPKKEYPLYQAGLPNLNDTKYKTLRFSDGECNPCDLKTVCLVTNSDDKKYIRSIAFHAGSNPSSINAFQKSGQPIILNPKMLKCDLAHQVWKRIMCDLIKNTSNQNLLQEIKYSEKNISEFEWETKLKPLFKYPYFEIFEQLKMEMEMEMKDLNNTEINPVVIFNKLLDMNWLVETNYGEIYPNSMFTLYSFYLKQQQQQQQQQQLE